MLEFRKALIKTPYNSKLPWIWAGEGQAFRGSREGGGSTHLCRSFLVAASRFALFTTSRENYRIQRTMAYF